MKKLLLKAYFWLIYGLLSITSVLEKVADFIDDAFEDMGDAMCDHLIEVAKKIDKVNRSKKNK
jgi:hypothetical protein